MTSQTNARFKVEKKSYGEEGRLFVVVDTLLGKSLIEEGGFANSEDAQQVANEFNKKPLLNLDL